MVAHHTQGYQTCHFSQTCLAIKERADFCLWFPGAQQPRRHQSCDWVAVWPKILVKQPLNLHGPACLGRVTDLVSALSSAGLRSSNIQGQEETMIIVHRKGRMKLNKIRCYGLLTHFNTDVLLKIDLMGSVKITELLRTSGSPLTVLAQVFLRKPGRGELGAGTHSSPAPALATLSFWTWVLPVLHFRGKWAQIMFTWFLLRTTFKKLCWINVIGNRIQCSGQSQRKPAVL